MPPSWTISESAYLVAALHFAKHGSSDVVFGLLLGDSSTRKICAAIPISHTYLMPASLSIAFAITHEYADTHLTEIIGVYSKTSAQLKLVLPLIASKLKKGSGAVSLLFDAEKLAKDELMFSARTDKGDGVLIACDGGLCASQLTMLIDQDAYLKLVDMDEHLADPSLDFFNNDMLVKM